MLSRAVRITDWRVVLPTLLTLFGALSLALPLSASDSVAIKAMQDELARSMKKLQLEVLQKPYFISYRIQEITRTAATGSFGALLTSGESHLRTLTVEVRVGGYTLDNTNFTSPSFGRVVSLPLEDDYNEIRRQIWMATDGAYKAALVDLSRKKAALESAHLADDTPDFSREQPTRLDDESAPAKLDLSEAEKTVRSLSAPFREMPQVQNSAVVLMAQTVHTLYLNSEGTTFTRTEPVVSFLAYASAQAPDGMPLPNFESAFGRSLNDLPPQAELIRRIRRMGDEVKQGQGAPLADLYNGPVLIETRSAARMFAGIFAGRLLANRRPLIQASQPEDSFLDKIGARVLPDFLNVTDDPTRAKYDDTPLFGTYKVDDEGVRARETRLVEGGYLKTLLATRDPVRGINASTGNERGSGPLWSNLIVAADKALTPGQMKQQLIDLAKKRGKEYGILVDDEGMTYRAYPDGRLEAVRNAEMPSLSYEAFKDILAAGSASGTYTEMFPTSTGTHLVAFVVPSLLFEDVTVRKPTGEVAKLPIAGNPYFEK